MKTDREWLELAAKAAGIAGDYVNENTMIREFCFERYEYIRTQSGGWNPLTDDGDALRLAVNLEREVKADFWSRVISLRSVCDFMHDPHSATRRAIVRAAAEIGASMK